MVREIVIGQRMDQHREPAGFEHFRDLRQHGSPEMNLELRQGMWPDAGLTHAPHEQQVRQHAAHQHVAELLVQAMRRVPRVLVIVDVRVERILGFRRLMTHANVPPQTIATQIGRLQYRAGAALLHALPGARHRCAGWTARHSAGNSNGAASAAKVRSAAVKRSPTRNRRPWRKRSSTVAKNSAHARERAFRAFGRDLVRRAHQQPRQRRDHRNEACLEPWHTA